MTKARIAKIDFDTLTIIYRELKEGRLFIEDFETKRDMLRKLDEIKWLEKDALRIEFAEK
ncbi:hypothetical protein FACS1894192_08090 [Bacilli bacterium]|nr:hypothetical protein FACS1894192_08090 [Bacilli bacterium]